MFKDSNNNYMIDEWEAIGTDLYYYYGDEEITLEEYDSYLIQGDYEVICGRETASAMIAQLSQ